MSVMGMAPAWKRARKWSGVEQVLDDPARAKAVMVEIKRVQEWIDNSLL